MNNLKISDAIATYNGEKYIYDQIQSILDQSLLPDEIVILICFLLRGINVGALSSVTSMCSCVCRT